MNDAIGNDNLAGALISRGDRGGLGMTMECVGQLAVGERQWMNLTPREYHAYPAFGSSALKCFAVEGHLDFWAKYVARTKVIKDTDALRMGRAFHAAMEGDEQWMSRYRVMPDKVMDDEVAREINASLGNSKAERLEPGAELNFRLKSHRLYRDFHMCAAIENDQDWLTKAEVEKVHQQVNAVFDNAACCDLLAQTTQLFSEVACLYNHNGTLLKALIDKRTTRGILDFKKTCFRNPQDTLRDMMNRKYHYQMGMYLYVTGLEEAHIISVSDEYPFEAHPWKMPPQEMQDCIARARHIADNIDFLLKAALLDTDTDSQGVPPTFHNDLWGSELEYDPVALSMRMGRMQ